MSVINKLASSLHRRDEVPNQELAKQIAKTGDKKAVKIVARDYIDGKVFSIAKITGCNGEE